MTTIGNDLTAQEKGSVSWLTLVIGGLLFFTIWKTGGASLSLTPSNANRSFSHLSMSEMAAGKTGYLRQLIWFCFGSLGLYFHAVNPKRALRAWSSGWPLLVLLALIFLSVLWSSVPDITLRRAVKHFLIIASVTGVAMAVRSPGELLRLAVVVTGIIMCLNFAAVFLFPAAATDTAGNFQGLHNHKNTAGTFTMVVVLIWVAAARWSTGRWGPGMLICGALLWFLFLIGTYSRTSILCTLIAILFVVPAQYGIRRPGPGVIAALGALFLLLVSVFVLVMFNVSPSDLIDFLEGRKTTLTGRSDVWDIAYQGYLENPALGTGYSSFWVAGSITPAEQYSPLKLTEFLLRLTQAHNGYLDLLATMGLLGAVAFSVFLMSFVFVQLRAVTSAKESRDRRALIELSGFVLTASLVHNLTQTTFLTGHILYVVLVLCYVVLCALPTYDDPSPDESSAPAPESPLRAHARSQRAPGPS